MLFGSNESPEFRTRWFLHYVWGRLEADCTELFVYKVFLPKILICDLFSHAFFNLFSWYFIYFFHSEKKGKSCYSQSVFWANLWFNTNTVGGSCLFYFCLMSTTEQKINSKLYLFVTHAHTNRSESIQTKIFSKWATHTNTHTHSHSHKRIYRSKQKAATLSIFSCTEKESKEFPKASNRFILLQTTVCFMPVVKSAINWNFFAFCFNGILTKMRWMKKNP